MRKVFFIFIIIHLNLQIKAQSASTLRDTARIYTEVDFTAEFPGGLDAFNSYIDINSAKILKADHISGDVIASIVIEGNGKVTRPVIVKSLIAPMDSAAIYLLINCPLWKPAYKNGLPVPSRLGIAVRFDSSGNTHNANNTNSKITDTKTVYVTIDEPISTPIPVYDGNKIFNGYEIEPSFVGGRDKFNEYIKQNLVWPANSKKIKGRVLLNFVVEKDGTLTGIYIERGLGLSPELNAEAIRLLKNSPKWKPGIVNGWPARVKYMFPIDFNAGN